MHLKVMQQMTMIPRSVGVPPLSDANFEQVLKTNAMIIQQQQQQQQQLQQQQLGTPELFVGSNTLDEFSSTVPAASALPPTSQQQEQPSQISFTSLLTMGGDDGGRINNPLAGMGLSDEDYNMILQNLINGERFMGMGMDGVAGGGGGGMKRTIDDVGFESDERGSKRSRFEVIE